MRWWADDPYLRRASQWEWFMARIFGEKIVSREDDYVMKSYRWRGRLYVGRFEKR
jgi:hypothetical protein